MVIAIPAVFGPGQNVMYATRFRAPTPLTSEPCPLLFPSLLPAATTGKPPPTAGAESSRRRGRIGNPPPPPEFRDGDAGVPQPGQALQRRRLQPDRLPALHLRPLRPRTSFPSPPLAVFVSRCLVAEIGFAAAVVFKEICSSVDCGTKELILPGIFA
jgi:hypothetical protein